MVMRGEGIGVTAGALFFALCSNICAAPSYGPLLRVDWNAIAYEVI